MTALRALQVFAPAQEQDDYSVVFTALSDPIRRAIVERLAETGPMNVGDLSAPFPVSAPAISRHLKVLEMAGIVNRTVDRQWRVCSLQIASLQSARKWLDRVLPAND